ncbi:MAG: phytanoyl-CoA dioxygenase family protein [Chitinophagales bacterium]
MFSFPDKMKRVFADEAMQQQFEKNGYVVVDFYNAAQVKELNELYHRLHPKDEKGFFPSTFSSDKHYRETVNDEIKRIADPWLSTQLIDTKLMFGAFIVKSPGEDSIMQTHQDMTLVDETRFTGINIWCPLIDLTDTNGVLYLIPGSHRITPTYRGSTIPALYDDVQQEILDYMQPLYLKAGQAVIFDQSIIHYSPPNLSGGVRIVTNIYFTHKDSEFRICYWNRDFGNKVEVFEEDDSFMTDFQQFGENIFDRPKIGKSLGLVDYNFPKLTPAWLVQLYGPPPKKIENPKALFKDAALQDLFDKQGFVKVPFLTPQEIEELTKLFWEKHPGLSAAGFQSSSYSSDYKYKKSCSDSITGIFKGHFEEMFQNYRAFGSAFLFKQPDAYSELPVHQDWTIVDEDKYVALNIWVPLVDTDEQNGTLYVLPGSQYGIVKAIRCPTLPMFFEGNEQLMIGHCVPMNVKAGEAVVLNQSLVHYSPPNKTDKIRIAITSGIMSVEPPMVFHYKTPEMQNEVEMIKMEDNFLISFENFMQDIYARPKMGTSIGTKTYTAPVYTKEELGGLVEQMKQKAGYLKPVPKAETPKPKPEKTLTPEKKSLFRKILDAVGI